MSETNLQLATFAIQVIMLLVILFGAGQYMGKTTESLKQVQLNQKKTEEQLAEHRKEDEVRFQRLNENINRISVEVAGIK